jgi:hypothetical protein
LVTSSRSDPVADLRRPNGEDIGTIESDVDGYVLGLREGIAVYENDPVASIAARDDGDLVVLRDSDDV